MFFAPVEVPQSMVGDLFRGLGDNYGRDLQCECYFKLLPQVKV